MLTIALLGVGTTLSLLLGMPQAVRLWRTRDTEGLDPAQDLLRVAGKVAWAVYGLGMADLLFASAQLGIALPSVVTVALLTVHRRLHLAVALAAVLSAAVFSAAAVTYGAVAALGYVATASDVVRYLPQARRTFTSPSLSGVAPGTYVAQIACSFIWGSYGYIIGSAPLVVGNIILVPLGTLILVRVLSAQRRERHRAVSGA